MTLFASVHKLRTMGALDTEPRPDVAQWAKGILEFSTSAGDGGNLVPRRLVLRHALAHPNKGIIFELYRPELVGLRAPHLQMRGIEPVLLGAGPPCAMVQDWLVSLHST